MIFKARHGIGVLETGVYEGRWLVSQGKRKLLPCGRTNITSMHYRLEPREKFCDVVSLHQVH
jgi:hypothetical protein